MSISVTIVDGPLQPGETPVPEGAGAAIRFDGVVRSTEGVAAIAALDYEVYQPMAERQLSSLAREMSQKHGLCAVRVWHSRGRVSAGQVSFRLEIASLHRQEGLAAMEEFIDRMKQQVPIWKHVAPVGDPDRS
jgi:molybdopterin synthase catalytic subunit